MQHLSLFTTFRGRIGRLQWWIGTIIILFLEIIGGLLLNPNDFNVDGPPTATVPDTLWQLLLLAPVAAITQKRCNDRNWSVWVAPVLIAVLACNIAAPFIGLVTDIDTPGLGGILAWVLVAIFFAIVIDNGILKGTSGPNRYGSDPLGTRPNLKVV